MRAKLREKLEEWRSSKDYQAGGERSFQCQLGEMSWKDIRADRDQTPVEDWEKKQLAEAHRLARRLNKEFNGKLHRKAHILARALVICDSDLPLKMIQAEAWEDHLEDIKAYTDAQLGEYKLEVIEQEEEDEGCDPRKKTYLKSEMEF
jgi:hypothetical protein